MEAFRVRLMVGSATFTIVLSTTTSSTLRQRTPRIHHRRLAGGADLVLMAGLPSRRTSLYSYRTMFYSQCQAGRSGMMSAMNEAGMAAGRRPRTPSADVERELLAAAQAVLVRDGPGP